MSITEATTVNYRDLNDGSNGLLFSRKFTRFYKRIEAEWAKGKANDGKIGIAPISYDGRRLTFDLTTAGGQPTIRFSTKPMSDGAALAHLDLFRRMYKKEATEWEERAVEKGHETAVSELMRMDVSILDPTDRSEQPLEDFLTRAKRHAKEMGLEI